MTVIPHYRRGVFSDQPGTTINNPSQADLDQSQKSNDGGGGQTQ